MKQIKLSNIDIELFKKSFSNFKIFVTSDFEFDFESQELSTNSSDFDKWHLVTLASFYGGDLFRKNNELVINASQAVNITFAIDYNLPKISFNTKWNDRIELNPAYLHSADLYLTNKLDNILSEKSKLIIKEKIPNFDFGQSVFFSPKKYAYVIINKTLVFIMAEKNNAEITHIFEVSWNEI
jgi:hypothetical protein